MIITNNEDADRVSSYCGFAKNLNIHTLYVKNLGAIALLLDVLLYFM